MPVIYDVFIRSRAWGLAKLGLGGTCWSHGRIKVLSVLVSMLKVCEVSAAGGGALTELGLNFYKRIGERFLVGGFLSANLL